MLLRAATPPGRGQFVTDLFDRSPDRRGLLQHARALPVLAARRQAARLGSGGGDLLLLLRRVRGRGRPAQRQRQRPPRPPHRREPSLEGAALRLEGHRPRPADPWPTDRPHRKPRPGHPEPAQGEGGGRVRGHRGDHRPVGAVQPEGEAELVRAVGLERNHHRHRPWPSGLSLWLTLPLSIAAGTPTKGRGGEQQNRMAVLAKGSAAPSVHGLASSSDCAAAVASAAASSARSSAACAAGPVSSQLRQGFSIWDGSCGAVAHLLGQPVAHRQQPGLLRPAGRGLAPQPPDLRPQPARL